MVINKKTDGEYKGSVRTLLGLDREDNITLTDADIDDMAILDMAEMDTLALLPVNADLADTRIRLAVIYTMAAMLCPSMPSRVDIEVKGIDSGWKRKAVDYEALAEKLMGQASTVLTPLLGFVQNDSDIFKVAPTKRVQEEKDDELRRRSYYEWGRYNR